MLRAAVRHLKRVDPVLTRVITEVGPCRFTLRTDGTHFDHLARAIIYQQLSGRAAATIHARYDALYAAHGRAPDALASLPDEKLRAAGLSRQKIGYLRDLAARVTSGTLALDDIEARSDDEIIDALVDVKGIGRWTAQMFLMFRLGRPDVLPELDLGIRKGMQLAYRFRKLPTPQRVRQVGAKWAPYRTIASWYLWRSLDGEAA
jgi:3-methyladenine DNA glycosylase/8-oxoguanine DNA glycosylase